MGPSDILVVGSAPERLMPSSFERASGWKPFHVNQSLRDRLISPLACQRRYYYCGNVADRG